jgi:AraC-like DNA-binding protein
MTQLERGVPIHVATGLPGVQLFKESRSAHHYRVWHEDWYAFCIVSEGLAEVRYRQQNVALAPKTVVTFVPGEVHETRRVYTPGTYRVVMIPAKDLHARAAHFGREDVQLPVTPLCDPTIVRQFTEFCEEAEHPAKDSIVRELLYHVLLDTIVSLDVRAHATTTPVLSLSSTRDVVREVRDFLVSQPAKPTQSLAEVARRLGFSPAYISRAFSSEGHCPPQTLMRLIRVERGRKLLSAGESVKAAAYSAGFSSPEKFNQHFRTVWNMPPSEYPAATPKAKRKPRAH